jgi:hypothetical protein
MDRLRTSLAKFSANSKKDHEDASELSHVENGLDFDIKDDESILVGGEIVPDEEDLAHYGSPALSGSEPEDGMC